MEINSRLILLHSVFISISCTDSVHVFQRARRLRHCGAEGPEFMKCTKNTVKDTVWDLLGREMKDVREQGGRWPPPLREHAAISKPAWKMHQQSLQMTPCETRVVANGTNSTARTLQ